MNTNDLFMLACQWCWPTVLGLTFQETALQIFQAQRHRLRSDAVDTKTILLRVDRRDRMMMTDKPQKLEVLQYNCYDCFVGFCCCLYLSRCLSFNPVRSYSWQFSEAANHTGFGISQESDINSAGSSASNAMQICEFQKGQKHQAPHVAGLVVMENQGLQFKACRMWESEWVIQQLLRRSCVEGPDWMTFRICVVGTAPAKEHHHSIRFIHIQSL